MKGNLHGKLPSAQALVVVVLALFRLSRTLPYK
jgi:hypothetical protein